MFVEALRPPLAGARPEELEAHPFLDPGRVVRVWVEVWLLVAAIGPKWHLLEVSLVCPSPELVHNAIVYLKPLAVADVVLLGEVVLVEPEVVVVLGNGLRVLLALLRRLEATTR